MSGSGRFEEVRTSNTLAMRWGGPHLGHLVRRWSTDVMRRKDCEEAMHTIELDGIESDFWQGYHFGF